MHRQMLLDPSLLLQLETNCVNTDDKLHDSLPERARIFESFPLVVEYSWRDESQSPQPDAIIGEIVSTTADR